MNGKVDSTGKEIIAEYFQTLFKQGIKELYSYDKTQDNKGDDRASNRVLPEHIRRINTEVNTLFFYFLVGVPYTSFSEWAVLL